MKDIFQYFKKKNGRREYLRNMLGDFAHENKDLLVIVADPETDMIFVSYQDKMVLGQVKSLEGAKLNVVKGVLRRSALKGNFDTALDLFLAAIVDKLNLPIPSATQFYDFIANCLFRFQPKSSAWLEAQKRKEEILKESPVGMVESLQEPINA